MFLSWKQAFMKPFYLHKADPPHWTLDQLSFARLSLSSVIR